MCCTNPSDTPVRLAIAQRVQAVTRCGSFVQGRRHPPRRAFRCDRDPTYPALSAGSEALEKFRSGDVAAVALVARKPAPLFCDLIGENGLHFLLLRSLPAGGGGLPGLRRASSTRLFATTTD